MENVNLLEKIYDYASQTRVMPAGNIKIAAHEADRDKLWENGYRYVASVELLPKGCDEYQVVITPVKPSESSETTYRYEELYCNMNTHGRGLVIRLTQENLIVKIAVSRFLDFHELVCRIKDLFLDALAFIKQRKNFR